MKKLPFLTVLSIICIITGIPTANAIERIKTINENGELELQYLIGDLEVTSYYVQEFNNITGNAGQVAFFNASKSVTSSPNLLWDNDKKILTLSSPYDNGQHVLVVRNDGGGTNAGIISNLFEFVPITGSYSKIGNTTNWFNDGWIKNLNANVINNTNISSKYLEVISPSDNGDKYFSLYRDGGTPQIRVYDNGTIYGATDYLPERTDLYDLGDPTHRFDYIYADDVVADNVGNIRGNGSNGEVPYFHPNGFNLSSDEYFNYTESTNTLWLGSGTDNGEEILHIKADNWANDVMLVRNDGHVSLGTGTGMEFQYDSAGFGGSPDFLFGEVTINGDKDSNVYPTGRMLVVADTGSQVAGSGGLIVFKGRWSGSSATTTGASISACKNNSISGDYGFDLCLNARAGGSPITDEKMRIDGSGRVGIGTTDPTYFLTVMGTNTDGITAYFEGNISVEDIVYHTQKWNESYVVWDFIHNSTEYEKNGKYDHSKITPNVINHRVKVDNGTIFNNKTNSTEYTYYYKDLEGVILGDVIAKHEQALFELKTENDKLKAEIEYMKNDQKRLFDLCFLGVCI